MHLWHYQQRYFPQVCQFKIVIILFITLLNGQSCSCGDVYVTVTFHICATVAPIRHNAINHFRVGMQTKIYQISAFQRDTMFEIDFHLLLVHFHP